MISYECPLYPERTNQQMLTQSPEAFGLMCYQTIQKANGGYEKLKKFIYLENDMCFRPFNEYFFIFK
jgi:hypothetical protein